MSQVTKGFAAMRHKPFAFFVCARFLATLGIQMQSLAVGWQVYALSGEVLDLGFVGLAQFAPFALLIIPAGQVADHYSRRGIMIACFFLEILCSAVLIAFSLSGLTAVWPVFIAMAIYGAARAFMMPASQSIVINLVPSTSFSNAVAISSSTFHVAVILGPTLGGLLYLWGPNVVYAMVAVMLGISVLLMLPVKTLATRTQTPQARNLFEGFRFVRSRPVVLGAISLDLFAVLFGGATALLPAYANDVLHVGPVELGLLRTAMAAGSVMTAIVLAFYPIQRQVGRRMFEGVALFGLATILFALSTDFYLAFAALFMMGAGDMVSVYIRHLLVQMETPDAIRGRVSAVNSLFIGASNELGEFESGVTAAWLGLVPAAILGGVATLVVTGLWMYWFKVLRIMDTLPPQADRTN